MTGTDRPRGRRAALAALRRSRATVAPWSARLSRRVAATDERIDRAWERLRGRPLADKIFYSASQLADHSLIWHVVGTGRSLVPPADPRFAIRMAAALGAESLVVNGVVKSLFRRPRPVNALPRPLYLRIPRTTSFPSGHASSAFLAASVLSARDPRLRHVYHGAAAVVAASRIHVQIHHASDVAAGAALGLALGRVARGARGARG